MRVIVAQCVYDLSLMSAAFACTQISISIVLLLFSEQIAWQAHSNTAI